MFKIVYLPTAECLREAGFGSYTSRKVSLYTTQEEAEQDILQLLEVATYNTNTVYVRRFHFEIMEADNV